MFFWLKKLIGYFLMPVPMCLTLLLVGLVLLWTKRRPRLGRWLVTVGAALLFLLSCRLVSTALVRPLETRFPAIPEVSASGQVPPTLAACHYVVVLGAGNSNTPGISALEQLSESARSRLVEAVRLLRLVPDARLLVSGPAFRNGVTHATVLERAAISLGIDPARIQRIELARDTEDESRAVRKLVGPVPVALVTSAWHMPRAMALFRSAGVHALPCPADFKNRSSNTLQWSDVRWEVDALDQSTVAIRERAGYLWIWLRGKSG